MNPFYKLKPANTGKRVKHWLGVPQVDLWTGRHPEFSRRQSKPVYGKEIERLLRVKNEYFDCQAIWRKKEGVWTCVSAAPIIRWMVGKTPAEAKIELVKRGCSYEWL